MDEGKNISFSFNKEKEENANRRSIIEAREQRSKDAKEVSRDINVLQRDIQSYINALNQFKNDYGELSKTQQKDFNALTSYAEKLKSVVEDTNNSYAETVELVSDVAKYLDKSKDRAYELKIAQTKSEEEYIDLIKEKNEVEEIYGNIVEDNNKKLATHKKAQESVYDSVRNKIKDFKNDVAQLATITGLDNIYNSLSGKNGQLASYNSMRSQFNMSKSDFNQFKRDIFTHIKDNGNIFKYGFQDALDYMQRLGELGITDVEMAKEQMDAIMLSTKYLGMSADTQTKILKQARNTGNMDLLNQTNQTMVQIMNAQLGVSKDQLDALTNQAANLTEVTNMLGGSPNALRNFQMSASAIESVYGESAAKAAMNIAEDLLNNGGNSRYVAVLGENYGNILNALQAGDGKALYQILQAVQASQVTQAGRSNAQSWASLSGSGLLDQNTLALTNARSTAGTSYDMKMAEILGASDDTNKFLESIQLDFKTMLNNAVSWINAWIPLQSLQTIYYTLAIADMAFSAGHTLHSILQFLTHPLKSMLTSLTGATKSGLDLLGNAGAAGTGGKGLLGMVSKALPWLAVIGGSVMAISNGVSTISKAEEWQVSKGSAFLGGLLGGGNESDERVRMGKNAATFGLVGAGLGFLLGGLPGALLGGLLGATGGGTLGMFGSERIAKALGDANAPITNLSYGRGDDVMPGNVSKKNFPWRLTSPFGYRGVIQTSAGPTNPYHKGIDLAHPTGTPIGANNSGSVSAVGTANDGANYVIINSGNGYEQVYWHLNKPSHLKKGQFVNAGQLIGYMGMTGHATGPHLHFGLRKAGTGNYINPINSVNSTLFNATENGVPDLSLLENEETQPGTSTILQKLVDADTMSKEVQAIAFDGVGGSEVVNSVDSGFTKLISKLEELSARQDDQEDMLRMIAQGRGTNVYKY